MGESYYEVLGVDPDASQAEIEDAYRERVKDTHPDLNDDDDATERFKTVKKAHETLGDPDDRARYDRLGHGSYTGFGFGGGDAGDDGVDVGDFGGFDDFDVGTGSADYDFGGDPYAHTEDDGRRTYDFSDPTWDDVGSDDSTTDEDGRERRDIFETAAQERRSGRRQHVREEDDSETATGQTDGGFAVHQWDGTPEESTPLGLHLTQDMAVVASIVFVLYPVFLFSAVTPMFSALTNVVVGVCTLLTVGYLMSLPELGLVVFGAWSVLAPVALVTVVPWNPLSLLGLVVLAVCWLPFGYTLLVARVTRF
jgi:curved DNA-binding protein CbpA